MKSPFPGMDPFIEASGLWEGFHNHLVEEIYRALARVLPKGYTADTATRSYVVVIDGNSGAEDLVNINIPEPPPPSRKKEGYAAGSIPMLSVIACEFKESYIEVYKGRKERSLVTCIEVLSPLNKRPGTEGWKQYVRKRQAVFPCAANFVEIDLLRSGTKPPMVTEWPDSPYTLLVSRRTDAPDCRVWRGHFAGRLPIIPVPLYSPDPDLSLDLQPLIDDIYTLGRYDERIDYARPLTPPLAGDDAARVRELLSGIAARPTRKQRGSS